MLTTLELIAMVAAATEIIKTFTDERLLTKASPVHDNAIRLLAILLGIGALAMNQNGVAANSAAILVLIYQGGLIGGAAIGVYHTATDVIPALAAAKPTVTSKEKRKEATTASPVPETPTQVAAEVEAIAPVVIPEVMQFVNPRKYP